MARKPKTQRVKKPKKSKSNKTQYMTKNQLLQSRYKEVEVKTEHMVALLFTIIKTELHGYLWLRDRELFTKTEWKNWGEKKYYQFIEKIHEHEHTYLFVKKANDELRYQFKGVQRKLESYTEFDLNNVSNRLWGDLKPVINKFENYTNSLFTIDSRNARLYDMLCSACFVTKKILNENDCFDKKTRTYLKSFITRIENLILNPLKDNIEYLEFAQPSYWKIAECMRISSQLYREEFKEAKHEYYNSLVKYSYKNLLWEYEQIKELENEFTEKFKEQLKEIDQKVC